jgi:hypothetical protein
MGIQDSFPQVRNQGTMRESKMRENSSWLSLLNYYLFVLLGADNLNRKSVPEDHFKMMLEEYSHNYPEVSRTKSSMKI